MLADLQVNLLKKYEAERKPANIMMMAILDGFQKAYSVDFGPLNYLRAAAFNGANYISPLKRSIISFASGEQKLPIFLWTEKCCLGKVIDWLHFAHGQSFLLLLSCIDQNKFWPNIQQHHCFFSFLFMGLRMNQNEPVAIFILFTPCKVVFMQQWKEFVQSCILLSFVCCGEKNILWAYALIGEFRARSFENMFAVCCFLIII